MKLLSSSTTLAEPRITENHEHNTGSSIIRTEHQKHSIFNLRKVTYLASPILAYQNRPPRPPGSRASQMELLEETNKLQKLEFVANTRNLNNL